jgi:hypothetical protein
MNSPLSEEEFAFSMEGIFNGVQNYRKKIFLK